MYGVIIPCSGRLFFSFCDCRKVPSSKKYIYILNEVINCASHENKLLKKNKEFHHHVISKYSSIIIVETKMKGYKRKFQYLYLSPGQMTLSLKICGLFLKGIFINV